ncbi:MAG: hypothetical protein NVSMB55_04200 [Mycobacteriales bacterium]
MRRPTVPLLAAAALCAAVAWPAAASTPAGSGTLTPAPSPGVVSRAWTGMIAGANPTSDCTQTPAGATNDGHTFSLSIPAGFYTHGRHVVMSVTELAASADSILTVTKAGKALASSDNSSVGGAESYTVPDPTSGSYNAITCAFAGASSYTASVTLRTVIDTSTGPLGGSSRTAGPFAYGNYSLASIPGAASSGEPSIGADWTNGNVYFQANLNTIKARFPATGSGAPRLSDVSCLITTANTLDPILFTDSTTGRTGVSQLAASPAVLNSITNFFQGNPEGPQAVCDPSQGGGEIAGPDHQTLGGGPYPKKLPSGAGPTSAYKHAFYYCSQTIVAGALCARSDDAGRTFLNGLPPYTTECGGLHGHVRVGPEGNVYLPNKSCGSGQGLLVSTDAGQSWTLHAVTGTTVSDGSDPSVAADRAGNVYFAAVNSDGRPSVSVSSNKGATWRKPVYVGDSVKIKNSVYPEVIAGDAGRATMAFVGTPTAGNRNVAGFGLSKDGKTYTGGAFDLYVSTTVDAGATWRTQDITASDPVQRGQICTNGTTCSAGRNLLDFNDITVDKTGHVLIGYADGCTAACVTSTNVSDNKQTAVGVIARQISGPLLFVPPSAAGSARGVPAAAPAPGTASGPSPAGSQLPRTGSGLGVPAAGLALVTTAFILVRRRRRLS